MIAQIKSCYRIGRQISVRLILVVLGCCLLIPSAFAEQNESSLRPAVVRQAKKKRVIGATVTIYEKQSKLPIRARVDTGATTCSIHVVKMEIDNAAEQKCDNVGKMLRFKVSNGKDEVWLLAKIEEYAVITTPDYEEYRYKVLMTLRWNDVEKKVLVTLNDRSKMTFPMLLGRNFLRGDFLVDVDLDNDRTVRRVASPIK